MMAEGMTRYAALNGTNIDKNWNKGYKNRTWKG